MANSFQSEQEAPEIGTVAELAENIVYRLPGCSDLMVRKTLQEVYRDFCRRSCCLHGRRLFGFEDASMGVKVAPIHGGRVESVSSASSRGMRLVQGVDWEFDGGMFFVNRGSHRVGPFDAIEVVTSETPPIGGESAPNEFIRRWGDAICSGAMARLSAMTGRAWSDASVAAEERTRYENFVNEARVGECTERGEVSSYDPSGLL